MSEENSLWMGDISPWMDELNIISSFNHYKFYPINIKLIKGKLTNKNKNYCFVFFKNEAETNDALNQLNGKIIPNTANVFKLNWASYHSPINRTIYVGNLNKSIDDVMLLNFFKTFYKSANKATIKKENGISKGFGFVVFKKENEYKNSLVEMNGKIFEGCNIIVREQRRKDDKNNNSNLDENNKNEFDVNKINEVKNNIFSNKNPINNINYNYINNNMNNNINNNIVMNFNLGNNINILNQLPPLSNNSNLINENNLNKKINNINQLNNNINNINNSILKGNSNTILNHYNNNNGFPFMKRNDLRFVNNNHIFKYNENYESYKNGNNNINLSFSINDKNIRKSLYNINQNNIENMNINFNNNKLNNPMNSNFKNNKNNNTFNNSNNNLKNKSTKNKKNKGSNKNYQLKKLEILEKIDEATLIKKIINSVNKTFYNYKILCSSNGNKLHLSNMLIYYCTDFYGNKSTE